MRISKKKYLEAQDIVDTYELQELKRKDILTKLSKRYAKENNLRLEFFLHSNRGRLAEFYKGNRKKAILRVHQFEERKIYVNDKKFFTNLYEAFGYPKVKDAYEKSFEKYEKILFGNKNK